MKILRQTAQGLGAAHDRGVIHRDVKPANLMMSQRGQLKIADFGIALANHEVDAKLTSQGELVGTPGYLSPEILLGNPVDERSDVYALGIVLFQMLAGRLPFQGPSEEDFQAQHLYDDPPGLPGVRTDLRLLIVECLTKAPQARPTPREVLERLERLDKPPPVSLEPLRDASLRVAIARAAAARRDAVRITDERRRKELAQAARQGFDRLGAALSSAIGAGAPNAGRHHEGRSWCFTLGDAELSQGDLVVTGVEPWGDEPGPGIDVIASAVIRLRDPNRSISHSLWYCDFPAAGRYMWTEFAFTSLLLLSPERPHALPPGPESARAFGDSLDHEVLESWPGVDRAVDDYVERWTSLLAARSVPTDDDN